jgi:hypothetical protein
MEVGPVSESGISKRKRETRELYRSLIGLLLMKNTSGYLTSLDIDGHRGD